MKRNIIIIVLIAIAMYVYQEYFQTTDETTRDTTGKVVEGGDVSATLLRVGDCLNFELDPNAVTTGTEVSGFQVMPCTELHDAEVVGEKNLRFSTFPTENSWERHTNFCTAAFESYTGVNFDGSPYNWISLQPTKEGWDSGDRTIQCLAFLLSGEKMGASIES